MKLATPEAFARDPATVHAFYDARRRNLVAAVPNAAHVALAELARGAEVFLCTQNIDDLHERAGARRVLHMHGEGLSAWCTACDARLRWTGTLLDDPPCPSCGARALRPDIVWFGEMPYFMDEIFDALSLADVFISIGTSGTVYPAAGFVHEARQAGAWTIELNLEASGGLFDTIIEGRATHTVPDFINRLLATPGASV